MKQLAFSPSPPRGRPRLVELSPPEARRLCEIYLATNRTRKEGSMEAAWVLFAEECGKWPWTVKHHRLAGALPAAAREVLGAAKGLVTAKRGGAKDLRLKGPYQQGGMRTHWAEDRRLYAGESYSVDDLTRNVACWIPWTHGGCKCSEKYGVRLGRWQTLVVVDDATFAVVAVSSVFRYADSYRGGDVASLIYQTEHEVGMAGFEKEDSRWVIEGGVWQSKHALVALGERYYSAKGRPMQKLIERWFGAVQTIDAVWNRDLGRQRGEILENNKLWLACRAGKQDPRDHFPGFQDGQKTLRHAITYMNEREVRSDLYGRWVPQERWERDVEKNPLVTRPAEDSWVMMPERRELTVNRAGQVQCAVIMEDGQSRSLVWNAPFLYQHLGTKIDLYFDPLAEWPLTGTVVKRGTRQVLGEVTCQNPFGGSRHGDRERVAAIRRTMMTDLSIILGGGAGTRRVTKRGLGGTIDILHRSGPDQPASSEPAAPHDRGDREPPQPRVAVETSQPQRTEPEPEPSREPAAERLRSVRRRAAEARDQVGNW